ncbi:hypothetical protein F0562_012966 [Nyssa sinensis]|uniref:Myb/SANT-like domain-containing protein n=1 Tax=Nyssa sinensis TaxID=561372 RepID=A0A5J4ZU28_9ASTE|nr:hypothetical protein F0562_012966 [Nyssa sinensis]
MLYRDDEICWFWTSDFAWQPSPTEVPLLGVFGLYLFNLSLALKWPYLFTQLVLPHVYTPKLECFSLLSGSFGFANPNLIVEFHNKVHRSIQSWTSYTKPTRARVGMMPIGTPRVPYRTPGEGTWQWVDLWNALLTPSMAIYGTMQSLKSPVGTHCVGYAYNLAGFLLAAGEKGNRFAMPLSRIALQSPAGAVRGQADDICNEANELLRIRDYLFKELANKTGQPVDKVNKDLSRMKRFNAQEALDYGLIDRIPSDDLRLFRSPKKTTDLLRLGRYRYRSDEQRFRLLASSYPEPIVLRSELVCFLLLQKKTQIEVLIQLECRVGKGRLLMVECFVMRADNGFKPGFYNVVERELNVKLPVAGIKAKPHIESRIKTMKRDFNIVYEMLFGPITSGFGWDNDKKCVVAEPLVWEEYMKSHKGAAMFKNKSLTHFEELLIIFGKDRATGRNAQTVADVVEELDKEGAENETNTGYGLDENDASLSFPLTHNTKTSSEECSSQRRRRSRSNDNLLEAIKEVGLAMGKEIKESTIKLTEAMGYDVIVAVKRWRINEELLKLPTISMFERHKATLQIARDHETTDVFFTIADDEKEEWVKALLRGDI